MKGAKHHSELCQSNEHSGMQQNKARDVAIESTRPLTNYGISSTGAPLMNAERVQYHISTFIISSVSLLPVMPLTLQSPYFHRAEQYDIGVEHHRAFKSM